MKYLLFFFSFLAYLQLPEADPVVDKAEAQAAFGMINAVRTAPGDHVQEFPFLKGTAPVKALVWNEALARVAEQKAADMARRKYFGHVDPDGYGMNHFINKAGYSLVAPWLKEKNANYFESLNAGAPSGKGAVRTLLIDEGVPGQGHRKHLLGIDAWNASLTDIGIGFVRGDAQTEFKTYTCILIAKHRY